MSEDNKKDEKNKEEVETEEMEQACIEQEDDLEKLKEELAQAQDKMMRVAAEADNFKKRVEREKEKMLKYAGENILKELLPTVDNLERALAQGKAAGDNPEDNLKALIEGVELTYKSLLSLLEKFDVTPVETEGCEFNPDSMDAMVMESSDEVPKNHVIKEFAKGYSFKDKMLRHAQVVVSSGQEK